MQPPVGCARDRQEVHRFQTQTTFCSPDRRRRRRRRAARGNVADVAFSRCVAFQDRRHLETARHLLGFSQGLTHFLQSKT